jgi:hypothetical protein
MRGILSIFVLMICLTGCAPKQAEQWTPEGAPMALQVEGEETGHTQKLSPKAIERIEAGIRKHLALSASTVLSGWHISGEFEIKAVAGTTEKHDAKERICKNWRFSVGRDGMLTLSPLPKIEMSQADMARQ